MDQPKYREDAKGSIKAIKAECIDAMAFEQQDPECDGFVVMVEDSRVFSEYSQYLTLPELQACFKSAIRRAHKA